MAVTIKKIAELAGVSAGTVDRALNNRGRVNPEVARRIKEIAASLNYEPNRTARSLHIASKNLKIAVIMHTETNLFFNAVLDGVKRASEEVAHNGVTVDILPGHNFDAAYQLSMIDKAISEGYNALVIVPIVDDLIRNRLNELAKKKFPVFLLTNTIDGAAFCEYIGCNYYEAGNLAAGLVNIISQSTDSKVAFFSPTFHMLGHIKRYKGFVENAELKAKGIDTDLIELDTHDEISSYKRALDYFNSNSVDIVIANSTGLKGGILQALQESGLQEKVSIIIYDYSEEIRPLMENRTITACIDQSPAIQGYNVIMSAFNSLLLNTYPDRKTSFVPVNILLKESIS